MYKKNKPTITDLYVNESIEGESIEEKVNRITNNKEPITDGAPIIFTERKDGVNPAHDIRTDRFEIAIEAMDKVSAQHTTDRNERIKKMTKKLDDDNAKINNPGTGANTSDNPK